MHRQDLDNYVRPIQLLNGENDYGPPQETESWQPIDAGHLGATIKSVAKEFLEVWMFENNTGAHAHTLEAPTKNWEMWEKNKITMREKRILMTHIYGSAWDKMGTKHYAPLIRAAFEKTGVLITRFGKNDNLITCESIKDSPNQDKIYAGL